MRIGSIKVPIIMVYDDYVRIGRALAKMDFVPVDVQRYEFEGEIVMTGMSPMFDDVKRGERIPYYIVNITTDQNGNTSDVQVERYGDSEPYTSVVDFTTFRFNGARDI